MQTPVESPGSRCVLGYLGQPAYDHHSKIHSALNLSTTQSQAWEEDPQYLIFRVVIRAKLSNDIRNVEIGVAISGWRDNMAIAHLRLIFIKVMRFFSWWSGPRVERILAWNGSLLQGHHHGCYASSEKVSLVLSRWHPSRTKVTVEAWHSGCWLRLRRILGKVHWSNKYQ